MKNRYWLIALFLLVLPVTIYFSFSKASVKTNTILHSVAIQDWVTTNSTRVYFVATEGIPIIDIQVNFDAGSARDSDKPGLATLCTNLLDQGTLNANADQIAEKFEDAGARFSANIDRDRSIISLRSLTEPKLLNPVIALFSNLISNPTFPDSNIETQRNQLLISIKRNLQQPHVVASLNFFKTLYKDHPYAHPTTGTLESVPLITKTDLIRFHQQYFVAKNTTITIVGGISKEQATDIANQISMKLPTGNPPPALPDVASLTEPVTLNITFPSEQTHVLTGQPCAIENDPDYFPLLVGNDILGGGMLTSRLFNEVRNERGLVYHVSSRLLQLQKPAPFLIVLQTKNNQTKEAIDVLQHTLLKYVKEGPTEQEVLASKQSLVRSFPVEISNNAKITDVVSNIAFYSLPLDSLATYQKKVEAVTIAEIKSAFERRINPEKLGLIVVGPTLP